MFLYQFQSVNFQISSQEESPYCVHKMDYKRISPESMDWERHGETLAKKKAHTVCEMDYKSIGPEVLKVDS